MNSTTRKQYEQLGMPYGTAFGQLRKIILFDLVRKLSLNICYRCGLEIQDPKSLSVEHKRNWMDVDVSLFWDLENITYSHLSCNSRASRIPNKIIPPEGMGNCWRCKENKPLADFPDSYQRGRRNPCTSCATIDKAEWRKKTGKH